ncbi:MAG: putative anion transporting ATPase [Ilumatobacteraceae bacterium]|nr:putative anion transporting ATPase [Ilumatobacteraceae bacterium]
MAAHARASIAPPADDHDIATLLASKEMIIVCGSGGVGKTTTAAALAAQAVVSIGGRVLVLTVDPAKRLANALGLQAFGNTETRVPNEAFTDAGVTPRGELWAAMLDTKAGWDELIRRHAPDATLRDTVLANPLYQNITGRFVQSHDYIAMERLHEIHASGRYDLVIIDTPPSRNALDILDAPARMMEFFGSRLLRWLTVPYRSRIFTVASKPFYQVADRILGSRFLQDIAEFFVLFQTMEKGFVARAREVELLLADPRTSFLIVSTLEAAPAHEASFLAAALAERHLPLGGIVLNRAMPPVLREPSVAKAASKLGDAAANSGLADDLGAKLDAEPDVVRGILGEIAGRFHDIAMVATREAERRAELQRLAPFTSTAPALDHDIHNLASLLELGNLLWREADEPDSV